MPQESYHAYRSLLLKLSGLLKKTYIYIGVEDHRRMLKLTYLTASSLSSNTGLPINLEMYAIASSTTYHVEARR